MVATDDEKEAGGRSESVSSASSSQGQGQQGAKPAGDGLNEKVVELFGDVLAAYAKVPYSSLLSIEAGFKLARYYVKVCIRSCCMVCA